MLLSEITCLQSQYQWLSPERQHKKIYCVKLLFKKISFSSITEGNLIYFFKSFFVADHFRSNLRAFRCAKTEEEALCFEVVKHLLSQCFRVSVCVRASHCNSAVYRFCYFGFKWKIKTLDKDVFVISFVLLCYSHVGLEGLCDCYDVFDTDIWMLSGWK